MNTFNFKSEVLDNSYHHPVVIDFWAPWCGPCRFIGPILDDLAKEANDSWKLVKINTDDHPEIALQYDVRGIPAIKMIYKGEVKAEFVGALPKHQVEKWLSNNLPDNRQETLEVIVERFKNPNEVASALTELEAFVQQNPKFTPALLTLAEKKVWTQPQQSVALVKDIGEFDKEHEKAEDIRNIAAFIQFTESDNPSTSEQHIIAAKQAILEDNLELALSELIESVAIDKNFSQGLARKSVIAIFRLLGLDHPLSRKYRHQFDMILY